MKTPQRTSDPLAELNNISDMIDRNAEEVKMLVNYTEELMNPNKGTTFLVLEQKNRICAEKCEELENYYGQMQQTSIDVMGKISGYFKIIQECQSKLKENEEKIEKRLSEGRKRKSDLIFNNSGQTQPKSTPLKIPVKKCPANLDLNKTPNEGCQLNEEEEEQIYNWTKQRVKNVIFNSLANMWGPKVNTFAKKLLNKSKLLIVIVDENQNKFGGYLGADAKRGGDGNEYWVRDETAFLFSLKHKGENAFEKYPVANPDEAFCLPTTIPALFSFGKGDLVLTTKPDHAKSSCSRHSFFYENKKESIFTEPTEPTISILFEPIDFKVYQMV